VVNLKWCTKLCEVGGVQPDTIIVGNLYNKAKIIVHLIQRLNNCRNEYRLHKYLEEKFTFPRRILKRKPSETIKDFDETIKKLKTDIENHDRSNMKLKEKIKQINLSHLNQKIKRQNSLS
jgi:predicted RNase H-like nuclease (RuvC/YqgF family)